MRQGEEYSDVFSHRIDQYAQKMEQLMVEAKFKVERRDRGEKIEDFDIRGDLYAASIDLAPNARDADIVAMKEWLKLTGNETVADLAAGGGFLTKRIRGWTSGEVIAVDPARQHLEHLSRVCGTTVRIIEGSPDDAEVMKAIPTSSVNVVTSFGGLHHVQNQRAMMEQIARILKSQGKFIAADVGDGTALSHHFDDVTSVKSITGHTAIWLSEERLREIVTGLPLTVKKTEIVPLKWVFDSEREMALFFKGLHAYNQSEAEILTDLKEVLGYEVRDEKVYLNWSMLFFEIEHEDK